MVETLSIAFLHILELLSPTERIAFLLREVFDASYGEVAQALDTTEENCRQVVMRARKRVQAKRPRFTVDYDRHRQVLQHFLMACSSGNPARLTELLRQDAVMYSDGGGKASAALNPIVGADHIARFFAGLEKKGLLRGMRAEFVTVNGQPGAVLFSGDRLESVVTLAIDEHQKIVNIFLVVNPDKLPRELPGLTRGER
jgi:RNA polymerase sigma-70 factor (ECF subfamily)